MHATSCSLTRRVSLTHWEVPVGEVRRLSRPQFLRARWASQVTCIGQNKGQPNIQDRTLEKIWDMTHDRSEGTRDARQDTRATDTDNTTHDSHVVWPHCCLCLLFETQRSWNLAVNFQHGLSVSEVAAADTVGVEESSAHRRRWRRLRSTERFVAVQCRIAAAIATHRAHPRCGRLGKGARCRARPASTCSSNWRT